MWMSMFQRLLSILLLPQEMGCLAPFPGEDAAVVPTSAFDGPVDVGTQA